MPASPFTFARLLREGLTQVPDSRIDRSKLHPLADILMIALCTVLCSGDAYEQMTDWARLQGVEWLCSSLGLQLPNGERLAHVLHQQSGAGRFPAVRGGTVALGH